MGNGTSNRRISTFKIAATYVGTVVGAGFASGQEILQFFAVFGYDGFIGLVIVTILFIFYGYIIMKLGKFLNSSSHIDVIKKAGGKYLGPVLDFMITFFLFGSLTAMIAGSGAIFKQQFNVPEIWGNLLMAVITAITVLTGIDGVVNSISFVVPFLLIVALGVSIYSIIFIPINMNHEYYAFGSGLKVNYLIANWFWAAILYASYNIIISVSVLAPLGNNAKDSSAIKKGSVLGGIFLGLGALAIYIALRRNLTEIVFMEIPMAHISGKISHVIQIIYVIVLLAEIYTTAVGSLFGFAARISHSSNNLNNSLKIMNLYNSKKSRNYKYNRDSRYDKYFKNNKYFRNNYKNNYKNIKKIKKLRIRNSNINKKLSSNKSIKTMIIFNNKIVIIFTAILAFLVSKYGFSNLVSHLYPLMGYAGCTLLISLLYSFIKEKLYK